MNCLDCDKELSGKRVDARFCNDTCKKRWQRKQKPAGKRGRPKKESVSGISASTKTVSHVVALKQRTKARILAKRGKPKGSSMTLPASSDASDSDVPPAFDPMKNALHPERWTDQDRAHWKAVTEGVLSQKTADAERARTTVMRGYARGIIVKDSGKIPTEPNPKFCIEQHGKTNDLARQSILSKLPVSKLDPNSDAATLARLNACQLKKPAKGKEGA